MSNPDIMREDVRPDQVQYQLLQAQLAIGKQWDSAEDAPLHIPAALEHVQTAQNLLADPDITVSEAQPRDPDWPVTFRHVNPNMSRAPSLDREMVAWEYDDLLDLFDGNTDFALVCDSADHRAVFFWADGHHWLFTEAPKQPWSQAAPEVIEDWIGSVAAGEFGAEPLLVHRDELSASLRTPIERVTDGDVEHVWEGER